MFKTFQSNIWKGGLKITPELVYTGDFLIASTYNVTSI